MAARLPLSHTSLPTVGVGRAAALLAFVAIAAYANSIGNGFAYDDNEIVARNPIVTNGQVGEAFVQPYWPKFAPGSGLYRPVTVATFAAEWPLANGNPALFHATNVVLHAGGVLALFALLAGFVSVLPAGVGAGWFAVHPVHTEAVANVVGRAELLAALFVLLACLLFDRVKAERPLARGLRLLGISICYGLALGSKEIAVSLPALLALLAWARSREGGVSKRLWRDVALVPALLGVLGIYLAARYGAVGTLLGETPAPSLQGLGHGQRLFVALSLWPEYLRLMLFPFDLAADYSPAVLVPATGWNATSAAGLIAVVGVGFIAWVSRRSAPLVTLGVLWFVVVVSPVSQALFTTGTVLGERTLYLPSVAVAWIGAAVCAGVLALERPKLRRWVAVGAILFGAVLMGRTVTRNPSWMSTFTMLETLARDHPESSLALRSRGMGLNRTGDFEAATEAYEASVTLSPNNYATLTEVGHYFGERQQWVRGEELLTRALGLAPDRPHAYRLLASQYLLRSEFRAAHGLALEGLVKADADRELFAILSESYIAKGDFEAAARARRAALAQDSTSAPDWTRLAEILEWSGRTDDASVARARALELGGAHS